MPTGPGGLDANGVWQYGEDDTEALASDLLNLGMGSVSTVVGGLGAPTILQVVSTTKTDTFSASVGGSGFSSNVTGLEATITPQSTSSTIFVLVSLMSTRTDYVYSIARLMRDATPIGVGDLSSPRYQATSWSGGLGDTYGAFTVPMQTLDSPATTSPITYGVQLFNSSGAARTLVVNRTQGDATDSARGVSTITLMEVAG